MRGLQGKVVIVTGGARGIGAALCRRLAEEGALVAIFDVDIEAARQQASQLAEVGARVAAHGVDITDAQAVQAAVAKVEAELGPVEVLVNNAGLNRPARFVDSDVAHWQQMISVNLMGPLNLHHAVLPRMAQRGGGCVVNVASDAGRIGSPNEAVYSACKGGVIAFSKTLAREMARDHVRVNVVCPGPTETQLFRDVAGDGERAQRFRERIMQATPLGRMGEPADVVGAVCFLASDDAAFITGQVISVSGGLTMVD